MFRLNLTYDGDQHATAVAEPKHNIVSIDCPYTGRGEEFSPASLFCISLASCMLLAMGAIAQRDGIDIRGTVVDIDFKGMERRAPHVDTIGLLFNMPRVLAEPERRKLERAAELCPIMGSIDAGTEIVTEFRYGAAAAA